MAVYVCVCVLGDTTAIRSLGSRARVYDRDLTHIRAIGVARMASVCVCVCVRAVALAAGCVYVCVFGCTII